MKHLGDITKINGHESPPVDIITGGSPCQDLSVAGKRAGLSGERSGLFMEQIRIIKEMRDESKRRLSIQGTDYDRRDIKPRYMVWENVIGAFSSGTPKGSDFKAVLEEICKVVCKDIPDIPIPKEGWHHAGNIDGVGDDGVPFSICWRQHDAQYWGVPQRRKRISLVADFGGNSGPKILFEQEGMSGNSDSSQKKGKEHTGNVRESSAETNGRCYRKLTHHADETTAQKWEDAKINDTLNIFDNSETRTPTLIISEVYCIQGNAIDRTERSGCEGKGWRKNESYTLNTADRHAIATVFDWHRQDTRATQLGDVCVTVSAAYGNGGNNMPYVVKPETAVRRITPMECERLQGYPDGWTDIGEWTDSKGKKHKAADSPRYKALGNSIALPFWEWMAERMINELREAGNAEPTMASLFDGIGGFPLVYSRHGCQPVWASEIEEFPIAVTKKHFGDQ